MNKIIIAIALVLILGMPTLRYISTETIEVTIKDKERITTGSGEDLESKYLVYTNDEVFENTDSFLYLKYDSSDVQSGLDVGDTFTVKVSGWRIKLFSTYRNIISIK